MGRDGSAGRVSDVKVRRNTDAGSSPWRAEGLFSQSPLSVRTLSRCSYIRIQWLFLTLDEGRVKRSEGKAATECLQTAENRRK